MEYARDTASSNPFPAMGDGGHVLVVDDTPNNVTLLTDILSYHGYRVESAVDGKSALEAIDRHPPDLVLLDVLMPGIDGFETCRRIRADPAHTMMPVVMVTALDSKQDRVRGLEAGADDFLSKPIDRHELLARVRSLMRIRRLYETVETQRQALTTLNRSLEERVGEAVAKNERLAVLKRFFSPQLVERIVEGGEDPLRSRRCEIVVVYLDLRGFTAFAETTEPEIVMQALGEFHRAMGELVTRYQGTLERFTGDGMMVFFNDPLPLADPAAHAASMAIEMRQAARTLHSHWEKRGFDLGLGIGIAEGFATVGAVGFDGRIDYAAIGTVTNLAARLCGHAAPGEILLSPRAAAKIEDRFRLEPMGEASLRGFARPVALSRLIGIRE